MELIINPNPCMTLEAAALVYGYVNQLPASQLTSFGTYSLSARTVEEMMATACQGLNIEDKELQFYFAQTMVAEKRETCAAFVFLGCHTELEYCEVQDMVIAQKKSWQEQQKPYRILSIDAYGLSVVESDTYTSFTDEVEKLPVPTRFQMKLIEIFMDPGYHLDRLGEILAPVAEQMKLLMEPWVLQAEALREAWRDFLSQPGADELVLRKANCPDHEVCRTIITMRYLLPTVGPGTLRVTKKEIVFHMGVAVPPSLERTAADAELLPADYNVFRLLSSPDCMTVLRSLTQREKSIQELSQELDMNPGSVFRHVNNLYSAHLLNLKIIHRRNYYTANLEQLKKFTDHLLICLGWRE